MNKWFKFGIYVLFVLCSVMVVTAAGAALYLQTPWGKQQIKNQINRSFGENRIDLDYEKVSGFLPFYWTFHNIKIGLQEAPTLTIESLSFRLSFWGLMYDQLRLRGVEAHHIVYSTQEGETTKEQAEDTLRALEKLPISISVEGAKLYDVHPEDYPEKAVDIDGRFYLAKLGKYLYLDTTSTIPEKDDTTVRLKVKADRQKGVKAQIDFNTPDLRQLEPLWAINLPARANLRISGAGSWKSFIYMLFTKEPLEERIRGKVQGVITPQFEGSSAFTKELMHPRWKIAGNYHIYPNTSVMIRRLAVKNRHLSLKFQGELNSAFQLVQAELGLQSKNLDNLMQDSPIGGVIDIQAKGVREQENMLCTIDGTAHKFHVKGVSIDPLQIEISGIWSDPIFQGKVLGNYHLFDLPWQAESQLVWAWNQDLRFNDMKMFTPTAEIESNLTLDENLILDGQSQFIVSDLSSLMAIMPSSNIRGMMQGSAFWYDVNQSQALQLDLEFFDSVFEELKAQSAHVEILAKQAFTDPKGYLSVELVDSHYHGAKIESALIQTSNESENWYYFFDAKGSWRGPFDIRTNGFYNIVAEERLFDIQELNGFIFNHSFNMPRPLQITWTDKTLQIDDFELGLSDSDLFVRASITEDQSDIEMKLKHFPLDFLSLNKLDLDIAGFATMDLKLTQEKNEDPIGDMNLQLEELKIWTVHDQFPLIFSGQFHSNLKDENLNLVGHLDSGQFEVMHVKAELPTQLKVYPFHARFNKDDKASIRFGYNGPAEEVLDFINIGPQHIEGELSCAFELSNTLNDPKVEGTLRLQEGLYENYYSGTYLHDIDIDVFASRSDVTLKSFTATDSTGDGKIRATGSMQLDPSKHFPFKVESKFSRLECLRLDSARAFAKGNAEISGNMKGALLKGEFNIIRADISIPDKFAKDVPDIEVTYVHKKPEEKNSIYVEGEVPYPIEMELKISAPDNVFINGRGLNSKWKGNFRVGGAYPELLAKGRLDLMSGEFVFSGRIFALEEGSLVFSGEKGQEPFLNISGKLTEQEFTITASLRGNISSPHLDFRSNPPLPIGSIMSYLIFGQDISELSPFQAVQLAATIASLSGEGPDLLETTRKSLGVDRLAFITQPTKTDDGSEVALKVGKYVTKGVLVSVAQGVGENSTNVIVEVDLKHGFIFQAESQQQNEQQGKFTLKWGHNY